MTNQILTKVKSTKIQQPRNILYNNKYSDDGDTGIQHTLVSQLKNEITNNRQEIEAIASSIRTIRTATNQIIIFFADIEFVIDLKGKLISEEPIERIIYLAGVLKAVKQQEIALTDITPEDLYRRPKKAKYTYRHLGRLFNKTRRPTEVQFIQCVDTSDIFVNAYDREASLHLRIIVPAESFYRLCMNFMKGGERKLEEKYKPDVDELSKEIIRWFGSDIYRPILKYFTKYEMGNPRMIQELCNMKYISASHALAMMEKKGLLRRLSQEEAPFGKRMIFYGLTISIESLEIILNKLEGLKDDIKV